MVPWSGKSDCMLVCAWKESWEQAVRYVLNKDIESYSGVGSKGSLKVF